MLIDLWCVIYAFKTLGWWLSSSIHKPIGDREDPIASGR